MSSIRPMRLGMPFEVPDVAHRSGQLDVAHALTADLGFGDFNAAAVADLALVADALILAAVALPVLHGSKMRFKIGRRARLEGAVVDGLRQSSRVDTGPSPRASSPGRLFRSSNSTWRSCRPLCLFGAGLLGLQAPRRVSRLPGRRPVPARPGRRPRSRMESLSSRFSSSILMSKASDCSL